MINSKITQVILFNSLWTLTKDKKKKMKFLRLAQGWEASGWNNEAQFFLNYNTRPAILIMVYSKAKWMKTYGKINRKITNKSQIHFKPHKHTDIYVL